jgi:hypothetical protein
VKPQRGDLVRVSSPGTRFEGSYGIVQGRDDRAGTTCVLLNDKGWECSFETHLLEVLTRATNGTQEGAL